MTEQIMIRGSEGAPNIQQISYYLVQTVLTLRDRQNLSQSVTLRGTGSAITICILIAEIVNKKLSNISQVVEFNSINYKGKNNKPDQKSTEIRVKLTYQPTEDDKKQPGFQQYDTNLTQGWDKLHDFVGLYVKDLALAKEQRQSYRIKQPQQDNTRQESKFQQPTKRPNFKRNEQNLNDQSKVKRGEQRNRGQFRQKGRNDRQEEPIKNEQANREIIKTRGQQRQVQSDDW
ncbi:hypothetical protein pb186bvf_018877 [Paramecium bursaria]